MIMVSYTNNVCRHTGDMDIWFSYSDGRVLQEECDTILQQS